MNAIRLASMPLREGQTDADGYFTGFGWFREHHTERRWPWPFRETQFYEFKTDEEQPLSWHFDGYVYRPRPVVVTDFGTTPPFLHTFMPPTAFIDPYVFHDEICGEGKLYRCSMKTFAREGEKKAVWQPYEMTRDEGDQFLRIMILAKGGSASAARANYAGVSFWTWVLKKRGLA